MIFYIIKTYATSSTLVTNQSLQFLLFYPPSLSHRFKNLSPQRCFLSQLHHSRATNHCFCLPLDFITKAHDFNITSAFVGGAFLLQGQLVYALNSLLLNVRVNGFRRENIESTPRVLLKERGAFFSKKFDIQKTVTP